MLSEWTRIGIMICKFDVKWIEKECFWMIITGGEWPWGWPWVYKCSFPVKMPHFLAHFVGNWIIWKISAQVGSCRDKFSYTCIWRDWVLGSLYQLLASKMEMQGGEQEKVRTKLNSIRKWSPININWKDFYLLLFRIKWGSNCSWLGKWKQTCANQKERCFVTSHFTLILSGEDVVACSVQTKKKNKQMGPLLLREMCAGQNMNLRPLLVVPTTWCLCWRVLNTHLSAPKNPKCTPRSTERVRALHALATQSATAATTASRPAVGSRLFIPRTWNLASCSLPNSTIQCHVDQAPRGPGNCFFNFETITVISLQDP